MEFAERFRSLMAERGISRRELARQVYCSRSYVSMLAGGQRQPSPTMARRLDEVLGADGELVVLASERLAYEGRHQPTVPALAHALSRTTADDLTGNGKAGGALTGEPARCASAALSRWGQDGLRGRGTDVGLSVRQVSLVELRELERTASTFRAWGHQYGGGLRRKAVLGQLNELAEVLHEPHPHPLHRRLFIVVAQLAMVGGHMSEDSGHERMAYRYFTLALETARESGDVNIGARVVSATARRLVNDGRHADALALIRQAQASLPGMEAETAALLLSREAWAQSHIGGYDSVAAALDRASALVAAEREHRLFGPAEVAGISGACFETLAFRNEEGRAASYARLAADRIMTALDLREPVYVRSRVLDLLGLANVRLCQREPAEAVKTGERALEHAVRLRSARARRGIHRLAIRALGEFPDVAEVPEFAEKVRAQIPA